jgi:hypothetical protein
MAHKKQKEAFTAKEILEQLDGAARQFAFPMLDNGYLYLVTARLSAYRNEKHWRIVIEAVGFNSRGAGHNGIENCLYIFGNNLPHKPGLDNANFLSPTADSPEGNTFDPETESYLNPSVNTILVRGNTITLSHDPAFYAAKGIQLEDPGRIMIWEMMRGLMPEHRNQFLATEEDIKQRIPAGLPLFIRLDEWNHPDLANQEKPGQNETFIMLADALETGDKKIFKPTQKPNTHWSNWPEGGTL